MIQNKIYLNNISKLFLYLFPIALVAGPFVAELIMNIISIIFIYLCIKKKNFNFLKSKYFLYFIIFYIYILINSALSDYASNIFLKNLFYIRYIIFIFAVLHIFQFNKEILLNFSKCLFFTLLIVCLYGFLQYFTKFLLN